MLLNCDAVAHNGALGRLHVTTAGLEWTNAAAAPSAAVLVPFAGIQRTARWCARS